MNIHYHCPYEHEHPQPFICGCNNCIIFYCGACLSARSWIDNIGRLTRMVLCNCD